MHSSWSVSPVATTILSGLLSQYRLILARFLTEQNNISSKTVVAAVVELGHLGVSARVAPRVALVGARSPAKVLGLSYSEELVDGAAVLFVVVRQLLGRAHKQDLVPPRLHGLAGVALAAAAVLRPYHDALVFSYVAAQIVRIVLVFDR